MCQATAVRLVRGQNDPTVFDVLYGQKYGVTGAVFTCREFETVQQLSQCEVNNYPPGASCGQWLR